LYSEDMLDELNMQASQLNKILGLSIQQEFEKLLDKYLTVNS